MNKFDRTSFLAYINTPISRESVELLYQSNNIVYEKCELYGDFVQSLLMLIFNTYMGDELTNLDEQFKHFQWCWDKNIDNFKQEGIVFNNPKLYNYFLEFVFEVFYSNCDKDKYNDNEDGILSVWYDIFNYNSVKTNSDIDTLIEIYKIFDDSLQKK